MIVPSEFQRYLQRILDAPSGDIQKEVCNHYIPTLAELPLRVQTCTSPTTDSQEQQKEKQEQFAVLEGLRKYAPDHVLLVGKPGAGKSTALRRLQWEEAGRCLEVIEQGKSEISPIPILIELRGLKGSVLGAIKKKLEPWLKLNKKSLEALLHNKNLLVLLDGLNELPNDKAWQEVDKFKQLSADLNVPLIITTRELGSGLLQGKVKQLEMLPLTEPQMWGFIHKRLPETGVELWRQIRGRLQELAETPLLLQMLCEVFAEKGEIPKNRGDLFRKEFARRYDKFKPERLRNVSEDSRRFTFDILCSLAFAMVQGEPHTTDPCKPSTSWITLSKVQAENILAEFLAGKDIPTLEDKRKAKEWLEDLLEWHLLQVASDPTHIEFHHQLFQEYYAGEWLEPQLTEFSDEELQYYYFNYLKWTEPLAMAMSFVESEALPVRMVKLALDVDLQLGARLAGEVKPEHQTRTVNMITDLEAPEKFKVKLLGLTGSDVALPFISQFLRKNNDNLTKNEVISCLDKIYSSDSIPLLLEMIKNADFEMQLKIACLLARYGNETAIPILEDALNKKEYHFISLLALEKISRDVVIQALDKILSGEALEMRRQAASTLVLLTHQKYTNTVPLLIKLLDDEDSQVRYQAVYALKEEGGQDALSALVKLWKDENSSIRNIVYETFKGQEREDLISDLTSSLFAKESTLRKKATEALGMLSTESQTAIESLFDIAFSDEDDSVRRSASIALVLTGNSTVIQVGAKILEEEDILISLNNSSHLCAAIVLMQICSRETIPILSRVFQDNNRSYSLRNIAVQALGKIGDFSVNFILLETLKHEMEIQNEINDYFIKHIICALGKLDIKGLESIIIEILNDPISLMREEAVETLAKIETVEANFGLTQALTNDNFSVRFNAACVLGRKGELATIPVLIEALGHRQFMGWEDTTVCEKAIEVLSQIGANALLPLKESLNNSDEQVKRNAEKAIRKICKLITANSLSNDSKYNELLNVDNSINELIVQFSNNNEETGAIESLLLDWDNYGKATSKSSDSFHPEEVSVLYSLALQEQSVDLSNYILNEILSTQLYCQFYNYDIAQMPDPRKIESGKWELEGLLHNKLEILTQEVKKVSEEPKRVINTQNYFEQGSHTHTHNYASNEALKQQTTELRQLVHELQQTHQPTTEAQAAEIINAEFREIQNTNPTRWQRLRKQIELLKCQLLNPESHLKASKAALAEVAKHYFEESVIVKAFLTYVDTMSADCD